MRSVMLAIALCVGSVFSQNLAAEDLFLDKSAVQCVIWNVESDGNNPVVIAERLKRFDGVDIWGLSEVRPDNASRYHQAVADSEDGEFEKILGTVGGNDSLLIVYDKDRFELLEKREMLELSAKQTVRAPLAVRLRDRTCSGEFWFVNNHLARGNAEKRRDQARGLREFAKGQDIPVVVCGDLNFDWSTKGDREDGDNGNKAMRIALEGGHLSWIRPEKLIWTNSHPRYLSILDMYLVNDDASARWSMSVRIFDEEGDFPNTPEISDHRPVGLAFKIKAESTANAPN